jgi:hypothetical protein
VEQLWESNITEKLPDFSSFLANKENDAQGQPGPYAEVQHHLAAIPHLGLRLATWTGCH